MPIEIEAALLFPLVQLLLLYLILREFLIDLLGNDSVLILRLDGEEDRDTLCLILSQVGLYNLLVMLLLRHSFGRIYQSRLQLGL